MIIDVIYVCILALAIFKGFSRGFIVAIFSFLAVFIGLAAALKLSATVALWLGASTGIGAKLLPVLAFVLVMIFVAWLVQLCAILIQKTLQIVMLGFLNKAAGVIFYCLLYTILFSVVLFYAAKTGLLQQDTIAASYCYNFIQPLGPHTINAFATLIPAFKNMFQQLEQFFDNIAKKAAA